MDQYLEGFDDALGSVPIVSAEYALLEQERDELKACLGVAVELFQDECDIVAEPDSYEWLQTAKSLMV